MLKTIYHLHTNYSLDSRITVKSLLTFCRANHIGLAIICDHNSLQGAIEFDRIALGNPKVVIGEEIKTEEGEIIALFINKPIKKGMPLDKTIAEIKAQGGLVCLPHPGETFRRSTISKRKCGEVIDKVDIVEIFNSRTLLKKDLNWAASLAKDHFKPVIYGSDAHNMAEISKVIFEMPDFNSPQSFLGALSKQRINSCNRTGMGLQFLSVATRIMRKINRS